MRRRATAWGLTLALAAGLLAASSSPAAALPPPPVDWWSAAASLTSGTSPSSSPQLVVDDQGNETVVYLGGASGQVYAVSRPAGSPAWGAAAPIPGTGAVVAVDGIVADGSGNLTAVWRYRTIYGYYAVAAARKPSGSAWGPAQPLNDWGSNDVPDSADVAVDGQGNVTVVWAAVPKPTGVSFARASRWTAADGWSATPDTLSDKAYDVSGVRVAADGSGNAMAVWTYADATAQVIQSDLFVPGTGWDASPSPVSTASGAPHTPQVTAVSDGTFAATWIRNDTAHDVVEAAKYASGSWSALPSPMLAGGYDAQAPQIAASATGDIGLVYQTYGAGVWQVQGTTLPKDAVSWDAVGALSNGSQDSRTPLVTSDAAGDMFAVWTRSDGTNWRVETANRPAGGNWGIISTTPLSDAGTDATELQVMSDPFGDVSAVWQQPDGSAIAQIGESHWMSRAPFAAMTRPTRTFITSSRIHLTWAATDWAGGSLSVPSYEYDLTRAVGLWNRRLGAYSSWATTYTGTEARPTAKPGHTYCFKVRGINAETSTLVWGPWSTSLCTTTPVDDRTAKTSIGWTRQKAKGFYRGTYTVTTWQGATVTLKGVKAKHLALLVAKGPKNGKIWVFFGSKDLGTYNLAAAKNKKKVTIDLATFGKVKKGTVTIVVLSSGKPVRIDGIFAAK